MGQTTDQPLSRVEREVIGNLLAQPIGERGAGSVADLGLPEAFLRRVAGRTIRSSFEANFRVVVRDAVGDAPPTGQAATRSVPMASGPSFAAEVLDWLPSDWPWWRSAREHRPSDPAFRVPSREPGCAATVPALPGFRAHSDAGDEPVNMLRLQVTSGSYWGGRGAGGSLDIARQLVEKAPDLRLSVSVERRFLPEFLAHVKAWPLAGAEHLRVIPQDLPVAQWAQDNARMGTAVGDPAAVLPRFAGRGEEAMTFVPGESLAGEGLVAAGFRLGRSGLVFQGGNLLVVPDPVTHQRVLLLGEAEVYRNTAAGLDAAGVADAFRVELGADRVEILPAAAFHVDYEISPRIVDGSVVALVNDPVAAARAIVRIGMGVLQRQRIVNGVQAQRALGLLASERDAEGVGVIGPVLFGRGVGPGRFPESLARAFEAGPSDSGVGNLQRMLQAMDLLVIQSRAGTLDEHVEGYLAAHRRAQADREQLHARLKSLGWKVVPIPSLGDGDRSINYVNGVQLPGRYLMPAYGGLFAPLDDLVASTIRAALGRGVEVVPILCGETQRRQGALRCAIAACIAPSRAGRP